MLNDFLFHLMYIVLAYVLSNVPYMPFNPLDWGTTIYHFYFFIYLFMSMQFIYCDIYDHTFYFIAYTKRFDLFYDTEKKTVFIPSLYAVIAVVQTFYS